MRSSTRILPSLLVATSALLLACSSSEYPNPILTFNMGQESTTFDDVERFDIERFDTTGASERLLRESTLPESLDMGNSSNYYQFVGTGYDADGNRLAVGRTLYAAPSTLLSSEVPMFFARTDRTSRPDGGFSLAPTQYPLGAVLSDSLIWYLDGSGDTIETDAYSFAYWAHVDPSSQYQSIDCLNHSPCGIKSFVVVGGVYGIAIADDWALWINAQESYAQEYATPDGLDNWGDAAGGRVLPGGSNTALLAGPTRLDNPTTTVIGFASDASVTIFNLNQARAGAALISETDVGTIFVGGSADGAGVEILDSDAEEFVDLPYAADPVVGAALVMEDETHLLRVGGLTPDGVDAPTVRIDLECEADCVYETVPSLDLALRVAQSFYDPVTEETLVVGEDADGLTLVYRYKATGFVAITIPGVQKRVHAAALELSNQQLALYGGTNPNDEEESRTSVSVVSF